VIRHMHDLAALECHVTSSSVFAPLALEAAEADAGRGGGKAPGDVIERLTLMLTRLSEDPLWANEYDKFVHDKSFARPEETISFRSALEATGRLADHLAVTGQRHTNTTALS
jgi:hypothetical protein